MPWVNVFLARYAPLLVGGVVVLLLVLLLLAQRMFPSFELVERMEWMTYDWRVHSALEHPLPVSDRLGFVVLDNATLLELNKNFGYQWPLPRMLYGQLVKELFDQGAKAVAFDIFFQDRQRDIKEDRLKEADGTELSADEFFARCIERAGNVILSAPPGGPGGGLDFPAPLFLEKAEAVGHAAGAADEDGVLRRVPPFVDDPVHGRVWQFAILLAARQLKLDLSRAVVQPERIIIPDSLGGSRIIPLDDRGNMLVDWSLKLGDKRLRGQNLLSVLRSYHRRAEGDKPVKAPWQDRLVIVGSIGSANNIRDRGATPIAKDGELFSVHLNVANSILMDRFVRRPSLWLQMLLVVGVSVVSGLLSWRLRVLWATLAVACLAAGYIAWAWWLYVAHRVWLPIVVPVAGSLIMTHASMAVFRLLLERHHRHHVRSLFGRIVSPNIVEMLVHQPQVSWKPTRRMMTVFFSDIRGFTEFTDRRRNEAESRVEKFGLTGDRAQAEFDKAAAETMDTVNLYLTAVVDCVTRHDGTLDKYIGDSVMAFWGAPLPNPRHAAGAVRAAMDAQRAVASLNSERAAENQRRLAINPERSLRGEAPLDPLELLQIGIGVNSGIMTVGFMGSEDHLSNFTVFGEGVNLASRFQALADSGIIIAGELTQREAVRQEPGLAPSFVSQDLTTVRGIAQPVATYRVLWTSSDTDRKI